MAASQPIPREILARLADVVEPDAIGCWPLAPGWTALAVLLIYLALIGAWRYRVHWLANRYRSAALAELAVLGRGGPESIPQLLHLLRRTALASYPRDSVAHLSGADWLAFIERSGGQPIPPAIRELLRDGAYLPDPVVRRVSTERTQHLCQFMRQWIRQHRRGVLPDGR